MTTPQPDSPAPAKIEQWHVKWYAHDEKMRADMRSVGMNAEADTQALSSDGERLVYNADGNVVCRVDPTKTFKRGKGHEHADAARDARASLLASAPSLYAYAKAVQIRKALSDALIDELTADSRKPSDASNAASEAFQSHLAAMGWDRKQFAGDFLETYRAAALAQAEGRNP
jgi:hypothetical protein